MSTFSKARKIRNLVLTSVSTLLLIGIFPSAQSQALSKMASVSKLSVVFYAAPGSRSAFSVSCVNKMATGTHPNKEKICAAVFRYGAALFAPTPQGIACSMIYGGDEKATVSGTLNSKKIVASFSKVNGCESSRWNKAISLFTFPGYSEVKGRIDISPTCPGPQKPDQNCTKQFAPGLVTFLGGGSVLVPTVIVKALDGKGFALLTRNGSYIVSATATGAMHCPTNSIKVPLASELIISCDTGIR
jgi:hypothetical protein